MDLLIRRSLLSGTVVAPPSVPLAHRALVAASLATGHSVISNLPASPELSSTLSACRAFGTDIVTQGAVADVFGAEEPAFQGIVDCGQSNTTLKMFLALAGTLDGRASFVGGRGLSAKPLEPFLGYLKRLGCSVQSGTGRLSATVGGPMAEAQLVYFPKLGTQFFAGLLMGSPLRGTEVEIGLDEPFYDRYLPDATLGLMRQCGIGCEESEEKDYIYIPAGQEYSPLPDYAVPAGRAASSFLLLAGALCGKVIVTGAKKDEKFAGLLSKFGAAVRFGEGQAVASAHSHSGAQLAAPELGSFLPHALVLAASSGEQTEISGISQLGFAQKRRLRLLLRELSRMGLKSAEEDGSLLLSGGKLAGVEILPEGDPSVAMACAVAGLAAEGQTKITGAECTERSFPGFFALLSSLGAIVR